MLIRHIATRNHHKTKCSARKCFYRPSGFQSYSPFSRYSPFKTIPNGVNAPSLRNVFDDDASIVIFGEPLLYRQYILSIDTKTIEFTHSTLSQDPTTLSLTPDPILCTPSHLLFFFVYVPNPTEANFCMKAAFLNFI